MRKMVQFGYWPLQFVLLCQLWQLGTPCFGRTEHSSVGIYQERKVISKGDAGEIAFFCLYVIAGKIGEKLDKGYRCPAYCEVKHNHIYWEKELIPVDSTKYIKKVLASKD